MIRTSLVAVALSVALASSTQAMPLAPIQQPDPVVTMVRGACGVGFQRVRGCLRAQYHRPWCPSRGSQVCGWITPRRGPLHPVNPTDHTRS